MTDGTGATVDDDPGSEGAETDASATGTDADSGYGGVFGAYPYAFRQSPSRLFQSYVVVGGLAALLIGIMFTMALVTQIAATTGTAGGTFSFVRAFFLFLGFLVVFPLMAPVLLVARRHRRTESTSTYDLSLAASGYLFLFSLFLGLIPTTPPELREDPSGLLAPLVALYDLPAFTGAIPPLVALAVGYLLHRRYR